MVISVLGVVYCFLLSFLLTAWSFFSIIMGGDRNHADPKSYDIAKLRKEVWGILEKGGLTPFMEKLHGNNPQVTELVEKGWKGRTLDLGGREIVVDEEFIAQITALAIKGMKV